MKKPNPFLHEPENLTDTEHATGYEFEAPGESAPLTDKPKHATRRLGVALAIYGLIGVVILSALLLVGAFTAYVYYASGLPPADQFGRVDLTQSTKIYDRNGDLLFEAFDPHGGRRTLVRPDQIPSVLKQATVATEDSTFYTNVGVDPVAVLRAIYYDVRYGRAIVGGSTIAQQLVKNTFLTPEPTVERKAREAILALEITRRYSKDEILTAYLNTIFYGNLSYGIGAASQSYFNKNVQDLDLAEAALLAGLPQAPALYDPCDNEDAALDRQRVVLDLMVKSGYIDNAKADAAASEMTARLKSTDFDKQCSAEVQFQIKAPHFVNYVRAQLEQKYGTEVMYKGGLQVTTSLDPNLQAIAEEEAKTQIDTLRGKNVTNAAVVIMNPHTGEILAMVGSVDFSNKDISGQVNVADRPRQPGSSIKPINYVTAFKHGWTPATPIYDLKTNFPDGNGRPPYVPVDYDGRERGLISARTALASSLNIPAVKTLNSTSTPDANKFPQPLAMINTARKLGLTTLTDANGNPKQTYGLALTLGGGEVTLVELTDAYAAFANQGARIPTTPYSKIVGGHGQVIFDVNGRNKPVAQCAQFSPDVTDEKPDANGNCPNSAPYAYLITSILSDNDARTAGFGPDSVLKLSRPAAVKTGTTNDFRDNWTIGYTSDLVVGVWVGNSNNTPMQGVSGVTGAAPIWHNVMERASTMLNLPPRGLTVPSGLVRAVICIDSGLLATDLCPANRRREEIFVAGHAPTEKDNVWVQTPCVGLAQVPPHDVGDLIPYHQILNWARSQGWNVPPQGDASCNGGRSLTQGGQNPGDDQNNPKNKHKKKKH